MTKKKLLIGILGMIIITIALSILVYVDWRIALGVFLFGWGQNTENLFKRM